MLDELEVRVTSKKMTPDEKTGLKLDVGKIPEILLDNTDRNRTSPFAFTGNRFEFRAVGASANCSAPMTVLNSVVAEQLIQFKKDVDALINKGTKKDEAIFQVIRKYIIDSKKIRFEGNSYGEEWKKEAQKRGLTNISDFTDIMSAYLSAGSKGMFKSLKIFTEKELEARTDVRLDLYTKKIQIESRVLGDLALNHIVPIAIDYQTRLVNNVKGLKDLFAADEFKKLAGARMQLIKNISEHVTGIKAKVKDMTEARKVANRMELPHEKAKQYSDTVTPYLTSIREHIDKLELIIDDEMWPLPKYREILFTH
jgi:glutamine synthetase